MTMMMMTDGDSDKIVFSHVFRVELRSVQLQQRFLL